MAPVANNSNNNIRQTGTVPKTSSKNSVPQEVVAPTRRDLQQHFNVSIHFFFLNFVPNNSANVAGCNDKQILNTTDHN